MSRRGTAQAQVPPDEVDLRKIAVFRTTTGPEPLLTWQRHPSDFMTEEEQRLYDIYAAWSGKLHHYAIKYLGAQLNVEFFPSAWEMRLYPGPLQEKELQPWGFSTVPGFVRPPAEPFRLPRPEEAPTQEELDQTFRNLCLAAAQLLQIDLGKPKLANGMGPKKRSSARRRLNDKS